MVTPRDIIAICQDSISRYPNDCAAFVRAVADRCGVLIRGNANEIVSFLSINGTYLPSGVSAREAADKGELVIGGLAASGHGHVVIVVQDPGGASLYPYAFWGQYHGFKFDGKEYNFGFTRGHGRINFAFQKSVLAKVVYRGFQPVDLITPKAGPGRGYLLPS